MPCNQTRPACFPSEAPQRAPLLSQAASTRSLPDMPIQASSELSAGLSSRLGKITQALHLPLVSKHAASRQLARKMRRRKSATELAARWLPLLTLTAAAWLVLSFEFRAIRAHNARVKLLDRLHDGSAYALLDQVREEAGGGEERLLSAPRGSALRWQANLQRGS